MSREGPLTGIFHMVSWMKTSGLRRTAHQALDTAKEAILEKLEEEMHAPLSGLQGLRAGQTGVIKNLVNCRG